MSLQFDNIDNIDPEPQKKRYRLNRELVAGDVVTIDINGQSISYTIPNTVTRAQLRIIYDEDY